MTFYQLQQESKKLLLPLLGDQITVLMAAKKIKLT